MGGFAKGLWVPGLFVLLSACSGENSSAAFLGEDTTGSAPVSPPDPGNPSPLPIVLAGVEDTLIGTWRVLAGTYRGDTARFTADSLVWGSAPRINMVTSLFPTASGKRLYARKGLMGLSDGKGADQDTVRYEYELSGDTLWLEYRTASNVGFGVDRTSLYAWPLARVRQSPTTR